MAPPNEFIFPTRAEFLESYQQQNFSLPITYMHYIWENPKTQNGYKKFSQTCKILFLKNPILLADSVMYSEKGGFNLQKTLLPRLSLANIKSKLWLTGYMEISGININLFMTKILRCEPMSILILSLSLTLEQFQFFGKTAKRCELSDISIKKENGSDVTFDERFAMLPKIESLAQYCFDSTVMPDTIEKLIQMPHFLRIQRLILQNVPEGFNIELLNSFLKENKMHAYTIFRFAQKPFDLSEVYKNRLRAFENSIIKQKDSEFDYLPPKIWFNGLFDEAEEGDL